MTRRSLLRGVTLVTTLAAIFFASSAILWLRTGNRDIPVLGRAVVYGCLDALLAVGIVLVYRSSRVINFAHATFGAVAAALFYELESFMGWSFWLAFPAAIASAALLGAMVELLLIRRFFRAPRLVVMVVTLGVGQLLAGLAGQLPRLIGDHNSLIDLQRPANVPPRPGFIRTPVDRFRWQAFPVTFTGNHVAVLVITVLVLAGLVAFFRLTSAGIAIRGSAENDDRANELGINTRSLSTIVWILAAAMSGLALTMQVPVVGLNPASASVTTGLLLALAAAVIGGMDNLPVTVVAAISLDLFKEVVFFAFNQTAIVDGALLGIILVAFLARRARLVRTDEASTSTWAATEEVRPIPAELARLPVVRSGVRRFLVVIGVVVLGFPFVMSPGQVNLGAVALIDGIVIISLVILTGWGGQVSLGQYAFVAVGALIGGALTSKVGLPFGVALILGSLTGAVTAVILGLTALRVRGLYLAVTTLAFSGAVATCLLNRSYFGWLIPDRVNRPEILFIHTENDRAFYYFCLAFLGLAWWAALGLRRTRTGRTLIAARDNERSAQAFGVNLVRTRLVTFALSGFMASGAGVLFSASQHSVSSTAFGPEASIQIFLTAIIGGLGSIQGALLGAVYFATVNFTVHGAVGRLFASSIGVLIVLIFFPGGLGSLAYRGRDGLLRRVAIRRRIFVPSLLADHAAAAGLENRAPLAPRATSAGVPKDVPVIYRQPSRIRVAGTSQRGKGWTYG